LVWFSGEVREPIKLLECVVYTMTWQEPPGGEWKGSQQDKGRKNEEMKEEGSL
jgi:hypothetical protein